MRELLMQHDGTLNNFPSRVPFYIHAKLLREKLLQNNHKHVSWPKYFNKNIYKYKNTGPPQDTIACPRPKVKSVCFDESYDHINPMENTHEDTHLIDTQEQYMEDTEVEQE